MKEGAIDCGDHPQACEWVDGYPTTVLFNGEEEGGTFLSFREREREREREEREADTDAYSRAHCHECVF